MAIELVILTDLTEAIQDVLDLGNSEDGFSFEEVLNFIFKFYGAVTTAVCYCVITAEEAMFLHAWLYDMFMGGESDRDI